MCLVLLKTLTLSSSRPESRSFVEEEGKPVAVYRQPLTDMI